jgi:nucleotide-binding universal stress UspA family protein
MNDKETPPANRGARLSVHAKPASGSKPDLTTEMTLAPSFLQLKKILVPLDFSQRSEKALRYAIRFSEQFGSALTLLHVIQPMVYPADFGYPPTVVDTLDDTVRRSAEEKLGAMAAQLSVKAQTLIRLGQPYHEIATAAKELRIDLIIITTHGHTGLKLALLGSTAERVVRHAPCPVLTLREPEHEFV